MRASTVCFIVCDTCMCTYISIYQYVQGGRNVIRIEKYDKYIINEHQLDSNEFLYYYSIEYHNSYKKNI